MLRVAALGLGSGSWGECRVPWGNCFGATGTEQYDQDEDFGEETNFLPIAATEDSKI